LTAQAVMMKLSSPESQIQEALHHSEGQHFLAGLTLEISYVKSIFLMFFY